MNATEMMKVLDECAARQSQARKAGSASRRAKFIADCKRIVEQLPKIKEIRSIVARLRSEGWMDSRKSDKLITDGINHNLGFFRAGHGIIDYSIFGIEGGGCACDSVCVNVDNGQFSRNNGSFDNWDAFMSIEDFADQKSGIVRIWEKGGLPTNCERAEISTKISAMAKGIDDYIAYISECVNSIAQKI